MIKLYLFNITALGYTYKINIYGSDQPEIVPFILLVFLFCVYQQNVENIEIYFCQYHTPLMYGINFDFFRS